ALPLNELQSNINSQLTSGAGLIARWGMDEGTGATISSSVGTYNGALTNGPLWVPGAPFNLTFNAPPSAPTLVSPPDGAIDTSTSPALSVDVSDPDGGILTVQFYGRPVTAAAGADFSIIAIPDTQYYTSSLNGGSPAIMDTQTQWAVDNMAAYNIQFVTQLGDCTEHGDQFIVEWQNADQFFQTIENPLTTGLPYGLPYGIAPGNHDQTPIGTPAGTTLYNQFFGEARFLGRDYYGGHYGTDNDNHYELFSASGMDFIVIHLEYDTSANAAVLAWADNLLQTYSTRRAIVVTHWLINGGNNATYSTQGQAIYNALKDNPNLFLMLGGHVPSPAEGQRSDTFNGNTVYSLMSDYQGRANGGNGWLRIITISPTNNNIQVKTYSPWLNQFETDADSQFSLPANLVNSFQLIGTDTVPSGGTASVTWPSLNNSTEYEWYAVVSDGSASATSSTWSFTTEAPANIPPTITGQSPLATNEDTSLTIVPANLTVTDPDNTYPTGFSLTVQSGANYTLAGNTITPALNFNGTLTVPVKVNDGLADSTLFNLAVTVTPVNDAPVITNPGNQNNSEGSTISLQIVANDVDNASLTYSATNLPTGLAINPTNGSINGAVDYTAAASSPFNVTVTASDGVGGVTSINFTWTITDAIPPASGLVCTDLVSKPATASTGEKPQSKVWQHDGVWWAVFPTNATGASSAGTWLWRLQGATWVEELKLSTAINTKADVKTIGDAAHILLYAGTTTQLVSAEYNGASYVTWSGRAAPSNISLPNSEIATIEIDSTGRMWLASENDATGQIVAYYSDSPYSAWSGPVTIATGVNNDDIATIIALPSNQIGILWSNQNTQRFGFRIHNDGGAPATWAADEVPASQSAQNVGLGM
ncbi:MAG: putative Ig domain-containing protein, partial [Microbacteriaceae bacterium]|nr:putative Ig domain-containing protein [Microbacteriaceae bacterium]